MKNLLHTIQNIYHPVQALIVYMGSQPNELYIESCGINKQGCMTGAHPLSEDEIRTLGERLSANRSEYPFFLPADLFAPTVLYLRQGSAGFAVWYTPPQTARLLFHNSLQIPEGQAQLPTLVWKADCHQLQVFALISSERPTADTPLYYAPFHNMDLEGMVCMGSVNIQPEQAKSLEDFIGRWQKYFLGSFFTHAGANSEPVKGDLNLLWSSLMNTATPFPTDVLKKSPFTINDLI